MSLVMKCDRCGKLIERNYPLNGDGYFVYSPDMEDDQEHADLCCDCYNSLIRWWKSGD